MTFDLFEFKTYLDSHDIFLCFVGPISQNLLTDFMGILERKMAMEHASKAEILQVFSVVVEKVQNIIHYSAEKIVSGDPGEDGREVRQGIIAVGYDNTHYVILSGNVVETQNVEGLRKKLTRLQGMNKVELKEYYLRQRREDPERGSKGAGLGFIDMARKASRPLEFHFRKINDKTSFFSLKIII